MATGVLPLPLPALSLIGGPIPMPAMPVVVPLPTGGLATQNLPSYQTVKQLTQQPPQPINLGQGQQLTFDPKTMQGIITPALAQSAVSKLATMRDGGMMSYSGSECRVLLEVASKPGTSDNALPLLSKQLLELTTLTVSIHRAKSQVRAGGFINPKGVARGTRTIAGTMIMTKFTADVLLSLLAGSILPDDLSKDTNWTMIDQLPPFNLTLLFSNEYGYASYQRLTGVELVTDGSVYSIQDMITEETVSYLATDLTPLIPLTLSNLYKPDTSKDPRSKAQKTVADILNAKTVPQPPTQPSNSTAPSPMPPSNSAQLPPSTTG